MSKTLIIYYSRTNITKKVAETLSQKLNADLEEIKSIKNYSGAIGYLIAGREATIKKAAKIEATTKNPADYDLVILGTPIWSFNISSPIRAFIEQNKDKIKKTAFFCTMGGSGDIRAFVEMEKISNKKPTATLSLLTKEVINNQAEEKIDSFINKINS